MGLDGQTRMKCDLFAFSWAKHREVRRATGGRGKVFVNRMNFRATRPLREAVLSGTLSAVAYACAVARMWRIEREVLKAFGVSAAISSSWAASVEADVVWLSFRPRHQRFAA